VTIFNYKTLTVGLLLSALVGIVCMSALPSQAKTDPPDASAADNPAKQIHISSQLFVFDHNRNIAEFSGDVHASQGETQIVADSLKIFFSSKSGGNEASPAQSLDKLVATGHVEIKFDNRLAVARQAVYITAQRVLTLNGPGARVTSGENTITGETITFYRADGRFTVEGGANDRVNAVILPEGSGLE